MTEKNRLDRELDNREAAERPKVWKQAELLPEPDKQAGYKYRWIRTSTLGTADPRNLSSKLRSVDCYSAKLQKSWLTNETHTFVIKQKIRWML